MTDATRGDGRGLPLAGLDVAVTGRLASMTREEAIARVAAAGGRYVESPGDEPSEASASAHASPGAGRPAGSSVGAATTLLVVGQGGPPLDAEGRPTRKLLRARELAARGVPIRILAEDEWLALLLDDERRAELHRLYTIEQLVRILGVERARIRSWMRQGLVRPAKVVRRLCYFDYQEVVHARAVAELLAAGVGARRLEESVRQLASWCGEDGHPLVSWAVGLDAGVVTAELPDGNVVEPSGQLRMRFEAADEAGAPAAAKARVGETPRLAERRAASASYGAELLSSSFARGVRAEEDGRFDEAISAYLDCEAEGDAFPEAAFNLGNVLYTLERYEQAVVAFERAIALDVEYAEAWNNLGNAWTGCGRDVEAERAFRRALALVPKYADAHFNLAERLFLRDDLEGARRHWRAYLVEDPGSAWAVEVRARLAVVDAALSRS